MNNQLPSRSRFGIMFSLLARRWRRVIDAQLATVGLSDATWVPLIHLKASGGGVTQKDLAARVGVDGSSLVRVLDILARQGLVERRRDENDGRARLIYLTCEGEERVGEIRQELGQAEEAILSKLSDDEIAAMLDCFTAIDERMTEVEALAAKEKQP